jgi:hypothetical protein
MSTPTDPAPERVDYFASACLTLESPTAKMPAVQPADPGAPFLAGQAGPVPADEVLSPLAAVLHRRICGCPHGAAERAADGLGWNDVGDEVYAIVSGGPPPVQPTWWVRLGRWTLAVTRNPQGGAR